MTTWPGIIYNQLFFSPMYPKFDFTGQTIIVTGANSGLGFEAARHFVRLKAARVILAVRDLAKGEEAKLRISPICGTVIEVWYLNLASYDSVKNFAQRCDDSLQRLDCLVSNAAKQWRPYSRVGENESTLTVNVVSTFLLAMLLLPLLRRMPFKFGIIPRLTFVVADTHGLVTLPERYQPNIFAALNADISGCGMMRRPDVTKLLGVLLTRELANRIGRPNENGITVNCVNPGYSFSKVRREGPFGTLPVLSCLQRVLARTTEEGSRAHVFGAAAGWETHGEYMSNCKVAPASTFVRSEEGQRTGRRLFDELIVKLESIVPGISMTISGIPPVWGFQERFSDNSSHCSRRLSITSIV